MTAAQGRSRRNERGQATIEFAIVVPLLLLMIVALFEFGKSFNYWLNLDHLANEGARWAAVGQLPGNTAPSGTEIKDYIKTQILTQELRDDVNDPVKGYLRLCVPSTNAQVGDPVTVQIGVNGYQIFPLGKINPLAVDLNGSSTMRLEQAPLGNGWDIC